MIPTLFLNRLVDVLQKTGRFNEWPLEVLFRDRSQFLTFLQERWPAFLSRFLDVIPFEVRPKVRGPVNLPFDNADVRVYIDNLFVEGFLQPIDLPASHE